MRVHKCRYLDSRRSTAAIVGARSPEQVKGWIDAANAELTPNDLIEISARLNALERGAVLLCPTWKV